MPSKRFTNDWDEHYQQGKIMCWPFWVVSKPAGIQTHLVIFTFDGTTHAVYEGGHDPHSANRLWLMNQFEVTRDPNEQDKYVSAVLRVSQDGHPVAVIPVYRSGRHDSILWHSGMWIVPHRLEDLVLQIWDAHAQSLYGHHVDD